MIVKTRSYASVVLVVEKEPSWNQNSLLKSSYGLLGENVQRVIVSFGRM